MVTTFHTYTTRITRSSDGHEYKNLQDNIHRVGYVKYTFRYAFKKRNASHRTVNGQAIVSYYLIKPGKMYYCHLVNIVITEEHNAFKTIT